MLFRILTGCLLIGTTGTALAGEIIDRRYVAIPPAYPAPPAGFLPFPASAPPLIIRDPGSPPIRPVWTPGRVEVIVGIDSKGRITHALEYTPGRFER